MNNKTVLVVEDNELNMKLVLTFLKLGNYDSLAAPNAEIGIRMTQKHLPDLIFMDIHLPDMNGLMATRQLKNNPKTRDIPVVALTAAIMEEDKQRIFDAGCNGYLSKPIDIEVFLETVAGYV